MRDLRLGRPISAVLVAVFAIAGCDAADDQFPGLDALAADDPRSEATGSVQQSPDAANSPTASPTADSDGGADVVTYVQPHLAEESVVELRHSIPVDPPAGASAEESDVVEAAGRFIASWEAILFGAGVDASGIEQSATGAQLDALLDYADEAEGLEQVMIGAPMELELLSVEATGSAAVVDICFVMTGWTLITAGEAEPQPWLERYHLTMDRVGDEWRASRSAQQNPDECRAGQP